jgi:hypothetical protein
MQEVASGTGELSVAPVGAGGGLEGHLDRWLSHTGISSVASFGAKWESDRMSLLRLGVKNLRRGRSTTGNSANQELASLAYR